MGFNINIVGDGDDGGGLVDGIHRHPVCVFDLTTACARYWVGVEVLGTAEGCLLDRAEAVATRPVHRQVAAPRWIRCTRRGVLGSQTNRR